MESLNACSSSGTRSRGHEDVPARHHGFGLHVQPRLDQLHEQQNWWLLCRIPPQRTRRSVHPPGLEPGRGRRARPDPGLEQLRHRGHAVVAAAPLRRPHRHDLPEGLRQPVPLGACRRHRARPPTSSCPTSGPSTRARRWSSPSGTRPRVARPYGSGGRPARTPGPTRPSTGPPTNGTRPGATNATSIDVTATDFNGRLLTISFTLPTTYAPPTDNEWWQIALHLRQAPGRDRPDHLEREHRG